MKKKPSRFRRMALLGMREVRPTLSLSTPIVAGMVSQMLMGLADTIMVGQVGVIPLAASAFVNAIWHLPLVFGIGLLSSVTVLASQAFGARRNTETGEVLRHGSVGGIVIGIISAAALCALLPVLHIFGQPPEVTDEASVYLILVSISLLPVMMGQTWKQFCEALNQPWIPSTIMLAGTGLNVLLNWILIFGNWGAPALGLAGAGWATLIARTAIAVSLAALVLYAPGFREYHPARWFAPLQWVVFRKLGSLGWPVGIQHLLEVGAFAFAALMAGWISADALAAHQIALTCAATTFMFALGIGMAGCIRVGHAWGARQLKRMRRIGFVSIGLGAGTMAIFAILFFLFAETIANLFVSSGTVIQLAAQLLIVAAIFQIADGAQVTAISVLRGLNDVRIPAAIAVLAYWIIAVPLGAVLAFGLKEGAVGIWMGLATGLGIAAIGLVWRFHMKSR